VANQSQDGPREQIHLPGPSVLPLATAVGMTVALVGLIISWMMVAAGGAIVLIAVVLWVRTVREEIDSLPAERH
jgi:chromate transport protein ChrA